MPRKKKSGHGLTPKEGFRIKRMYGKREAVRYPSEMTLPTPLVVKLGTIVLEASERLDRENADNIDVLALIDDPEVQEWIRGMMRRSLIPARNRQSCRFPKRRKRV